MIPAIAALASGMFAGPAIAGLGDDFGTRDPAACPLRNLPRNGAPSLQQATRYLACDTEHVGDTGENMYLMSDVQLQVDPKGRSYDAKTDTAEGIDPQQLVYDLRGSFRVYRCSRKSSVAWQSYPDHACRFQNFFDAKGLCWKDDRADWHCGMSFKFDIAHSVHDAAPPR